MAKGRPREFDADEALGRALEVFRAKGYEGASLPDLTRAMGISRPSLYAAFGNKEALFRKALDLYTADRASLLRDALAEPTARAVAERLLRTTADFLGDAQSPRGCLLVQGALSCGEEAGVVRDELTARRSAAETALRRRFERAAAQGELAGGAVPADLARFVATVIQGMSVQATSGASRAALRRIADTAMAAWPR